MDAEQAGAQAELNFIEFTLAFYNFLTSTMDMLVVLTFKLFDTDGGGIDMQEIRSMTRMVYGEEQVEKHTQTILKKLARAATSASACASSRRPSKPRRSCSSP